jgi:hypothetical protein
VTEQMADDPRFERLPKWAQQKARAKDEAIGRLTRELEVARGLLNDGADDAHVVVNPYSENRRQVDGNPMVEFRYKPEDDPKYWRYFLVHLMDDNRLEIHASASIVIHPSSGNAVKVEVAGR